MVCEDNRQQVTTLHTTKIQRKCSVDGCLLRKFALGGLGTVSKTLHLISLEVDYLTLTE